MQTIKYIHIVSSVKLQLQATSVGELVIKGLSANRYLAMNRDGRLFGTVSSLGCPPTVKLDLARLFVVHK